MSEPNVPVRSVFEAAQGAQIIEIIRLAEERLRAQLTAGIAADNRAMLLTGFLATAVIAAASAVFQLAAPPLSHPVLLAGMAASGVLISAGCLQAFHAARPAPFYFAGFPPGEWKEDLACGKDLLTSRREIAAHYDEMIADNAKTLITCAAAYERAMRLALAGFVAALFGVAGEIAMKFAERLV